MCEPRALGQGIAEVARGELLRFPDHVRELPTGMAAVIVRDSSVGGQVECVRGVAPREEAKRGHVQHRRNEPEAVDGHAVRVEQPARDGDRTERSVGLADEVLGREPPVVACSPEADDFGHEVTVFNEGVELIGLLTFDHTGKAGAYRID